MCVCFSSPQTSDTESLSLPIPGDILEILLDFVYQDESPVVKGNTSYLPYFLCRCQTSFFFNLYFSYRIFLVNFPEGNASSHNTCGISSEFFEYNYLFTFIGLLAVISFFKCVHTCPAQDLNFLFWGRMGWRIGDIQRTRP